MKLVGKTGLMFSVIDIMLDVYPGLHALSPKMAIEDLKAAVARPWGRMKNILLNSCCTAEEAMNQAEEKDDGGAFVKSGRMVFSHWS